MQCQARQWIAVFAVCLLASNLSVIAQADDDVLVNDSFEQGTKVPDGWKEGQAVPGVKYIYDQAQGSHGKRSLSLEKKEKRFFPVAGWSKVFERRGEKKYLRISANVKAKDCTKSVIDVQFIDARRNVTQHEWVVYIGQKEQGDRVATHDWKEYSGTVEIPEGTKQIDIQLQIYGPGRVWFDELNARYLDSPDQDSSAKPAPSVAASDPQIPQMPNPIRVQTESGAESQYILIPPAQNAAKPASGYPLLFVLPGGDGSAEFYPFVSRIHQIPLEGRFIVAELLAPSQIVWPTRTLNAQYPYTEESISAVLEDVAKRHSVDRKKVYALGWSSSGPAVYATILQEKSPITAAFIAMSVFRPELLPPLKQAANRKIYLLHSPEDPICPHQMAKSAEQQLSGAGATVKLVDYAGGHGWHGQVFDNIRDGITWIEKGP
jgi:poly(3-hydroxybutyrate) depolymerase